MDAGGHHQAAHPSGLSRASIPVPIVRPLQTIVGWQAVSRRYAANLNAAAGDSAIVLAGTFATSNQFAIAEAPILTRTFAANPPLAASRVQIYVKKDVASADRNKLNKGIIDDASACNYIVGAICERIKLNIDGGMSFAFTCNAGCTGDALQTCAVPPAIFTMSAATVCKNFCTADFTGAANAVVCKK